LADDVEGLNAETRAIWDRNAPWWDDRVRDGNRWQTVLINPAVERLLAVTPGELILDAACGNGAFSRRLAKLGARVVAFDFSERLLELARERTAEHRDAVDYRHVDATREDQLLALGEGRFDGAVCNMALMDMARIEPLARALTRLLKPAGRFVFAVPHPCFNSAEGTAIVAERAFEGRGEVTHAIKLTEYSRPAAWKGEAIAGQPDLQYYFHRPLSVLFDACFEAGFVLDGLEEPVFGDDEPAKDALGWANLKEIPPILVARMRPAR
jgi:2-polyprenyl-3-methyl-5-hydroxy-6-metoxy-1,4-benzoquinol methylase